MDSVIIDNCIITKLMGGKICITPISLASPQFNIETLKKITYGDRIKNNYVVTQLAVGVLTFENFISNSLTMLQDKIGEK
jgi:hypothetical protein